MTDTSSPRATPPTATREGAPDALDELVHLLYPELRRIARSQLRRLRPGQTLDTTSLVHETYVKLSRSSDFVDRNHFLAASARVMRHILVNAARRKLTNKRGGGNSHQTLEEERTPADLAHSEEVIAIAQSLERLAELDDRLCRVVECRFYAGMTDEETSLALGVSDRTVRRDWLRARAWLKRELGRIPGRDSIS